MPARQEAAATSPSHLGTAELACLRDIMVEERSLQRMRQQELITSPGLEPDVTAVLLNTCEDNLADLEEALDLLARGHYGSCPDCGTAIPFERLETVPGTRFCVPCQARARDEQPRRMQWYPTA